MGCCRLLPNGCAHAGSGAERLTCHVTAGVPKVLHIDPHHFNPHPQPSHPHLLQVAMSSAVGYCRGAQSVARRRCGLPMAELASISVRVRRRSRWTLSLSGADRGQAGGPLSRRVGAGFHWPVGDVVVGAVGRLLVSRGWAGSRVVRGLWFTRHRPIKFSRRRGSGRLATATLRLWPGLVGTRGARRPQRHPTPA